MTTGRQPKREAAEAGVATKMRRSCAIEGLRMGRASTTVAAAAALDVGASLAPGASEPGHIKSHDNRGPDIRR